MALHGSSDDFRIRGTQVKHSDNTRTDYVSHNCLTLLGESLHPEVLVVFVLRRKLFNMYWKIASSSEYLSLLSWQCWNVLLAFYAVKEEHDIFSFLVVRYAPPSLQGSVLCLVGSAKPPFMKKYVLDKDDLMHNVLLSSRLFFLGLGLFGRCPFSRIKRG